MSRPIISTTPPTARSVPASIDDLILTIMSQDLAAIERRCVRLEAALADCMESIVELEAKLAHASAQSVAGDAPSASAGDGSD